MKWTEHEEAMIHEVMKMSYKQGIEEGKRQAMEAMKKAKHSHQPNRNIYAWHGIEEDGDNE